MGTSLTGTKPKDTYDSLIKVGDNGPISGTAKVLSDGLGNDLPISVSTSRVGIGTTSPAVKLEVRNDVAATTSLAPVSIRLYNNSDGGAAISMDNGVGGKGALAFSAESTGGGTDDIALIFSNSFNGSALTEQMRITSNGYLRMASGSLGIQFNGDTAAANALDDYEEGTFTPTIIGSTTAGTATYGGGQVGTYTKIGNVVYFQIYLGYSGGTGTGNLRISGLPFTIPAFDLPSFTFGVFLNVALTASNVPIAGGISSTTQIFIDQIPTGGGSQTAVAYDDTGVIQLSGFYRV